MAIAGKAKPCYRMKLEGGKLVNLSKRPEMSTIASDDVDAIVQRLLNGAPEVHVYSTHPTPARVQMALSVALGGDA